MITSNLYLIRIILILLSCLILDTLILLRSRSLVHRIIHRLIITIDDRRRLGTSIASILLNDQRHAIIIPLNVTLLRVIKVIIKREDCLDFAEDIFMSRESLKHCSLPFLQVSARSYTTIHVLTSYSITKQLYHFYFYLLDVTSEIFHFQQT